MAEEKIVDKREIISIHQSIFISPYNQYMVTIERKIKNQVQIFKAKATFCESGEIGLVNLHIPVKNYSYIKIYIYNNTGNVIKILKRTIIGYLTTEIEDQLPNTIPDFSQLCKYVNITFQTIYGQEECYLLQSEQLEQINLGNLNSLQHMQLKILLNNFNNIFASQALGAVLLQRRLDRKKHPVAYVSRSLSPTEKNYGTPALKHLAIYWAVIK
ncbi:hypothetical protein G9A89_014028 [Geosiphon pyriformis]|nr:hypothetical protein G9A89_014028 [Geosiphon pyriformis]